MVSFKQFKNKIMDPNCIFCQIIHGENPSKIVYEDEQVIAFLDINPAAPVHILIVPKDHIPSINHLRDDQEELIGHLFTIAKHLATENGIAESGYRLIINTGSDARQAVFHIHLHLLGGGKMRYPMG
jgi:histidine triad (HIT) family protein